MILAETYLRSVAASVPFRMFLASDGRTPAPGVTPTVTISRGLGTFAPPVGTVSGDGAGFYDLAATVADMNVAGWFVLHAEATDCAPTDRLVWIGDSEDEDPLSAGSPGVLPFLMEYPGGLGATGLSPAATVYWEDGTTTAGSGVEVGLGWYALAATPPVEGLAKITATAPGAYTAGDTFTVGPSSGAAGGGYWGGGYWSGPYWGDDYWETGVAEDRPIDVPDGIRRRFLDSDGTAWITGGITEGLVDQDIASDLYVAFHDITDITTYIAGYPAMSVDLIYQFDCLAPSRYDARRMADILERIFHPLAAPIATEAGLIFGMNAMPGGGMEDAGFGSRSGLPLYKFTRDFSFSVSRTRPTP